MDKTETILRKLLSALPAHGYDIGILSGSGMHRMESVAASSVMRMLPYLKHRNASGAHIYFRPTGESAYTLLDDLTADTLARLAVEGYSPAAIIETSPGSFQAWLRHAQSLSKELGTLAAKTLASQFGADASAADWRRFGRAPGFTNRKPQHRSADGFYPFARLINHSGQPFALADTFSAQLDALHQKAGQERAAARLRFATSPTRFAAPVALSRFRASFRYAGRPAAADMAFCIAAVTQGWSESDITDALSREYLSRDTSPSRRAAYIRRTLSKAVRWAS